MIIYERNLSVPEAMQIFGVDTLHLTPDELKAKYRTLSLQNHPDRGGSVEMMQDVNQAYDLLKRNLGQSANSYSRGSSSTYRPSGSSYGPRPSSSRPGSSSGRRPSGSSSRRSSRPDDVMAEFLSMLDRYRSYVDVQADGILHIYPFTKSEHLYFTAEPAFSSQGIPIYYYFESLIYPNHLDARGFSRRDLNIEHVHVPLKKASLDKLIQCVTSIHASAAGKDPNGIYDDIVWTLKHYFGG